MEKFTVIELKQKLQDAIDQLDCFEDNEELNTSCNTYGMYGWILEIPRIGFINLNDIDIVRENEDEEDEE